MDYFNVVNLDREPFSNSPDPDFFFGSNQHLECLQKLELALRLRRGLNVVIGDVGTGKTTLCRQLIRRFSNTEEFETHLILDPDFSSSTEFLFTAIKMLIGKKPPGHTKDWQLKEVIKNYLFRRGVDENKTVILIIDEGQKIPLYCLELLREFLNYETNEHKLLQIVIFAQKEFENTIESYANFADRINLHHYLKPMNFADTRAMIRYRLEKSSKNLKAYTFFSFPALLVIYLTSRGYPRKIINMCHRCILTMIIQNRSAVNLFLARTCSRRVFPHRSHRHRRIALLIGIPLLLVIVGLNVIDIGSLNRPFRRPHSATESANVAYDTPSFRKIKTKLPQVIPAALSEQTVADTIDDQMPALRRQYDLTNSPAPVNVAEAAETGKIGPSTENPMPPGVMQMQPHTLGQVVIMRNETLYNLIENVYGDYTSKLFRSLILANPQIEDPDVVNVGQIIHVPAIPVDIRPPIFPAWWVSVARAKSLDEAYGYLRRLPRGTPMIRILCYWTPQRGMHFDLLLNQYFTSAEEAQSHLLQLPTAYSKNSRVVSIWSHDTVFYANPFFERPNRQQKG